MVKSIPKPHLHIYLIFNNIFVKSVMLLSSLIIESKCRDIYNHSSNRFWCMLLLLCNWCHYLITIYFKTLKINLIKHKIIERRKKINLNQVFTFLQIMVINKGIFYTTEYNLLNWHINVKK